MAIGFSVLCLDNYVKLHKPDCGFVPSKVTRVIGYKSDVIFDKVADTLDDAKYTELALQNKVWSFAFRQQVDNTPEATTEDFDGLVQKTSDGAIDMDFVLTNLSTCEMAQYNNLTGNWKVAFEVEGIDGTTKLLHALRKDGRIEGFSVNAIYTKSFKLGSKTEVNKITLRIQLDDNGTAKFMRSFDYSDLEVELDDYNLSGTLFKEVSPLTLAGTDATGTYSIVQECDGLSPIENIGAGNFALTSKADGTIVVGAATPVAGQPGQYSLVFSGVSSGEWTLKFYEPTTMKDIIEVSDLFFTGDNPVISL